jgi:hypothetical protein
MSEVLWKLPVPATALLEDATLETISKQVYALMCRYEGIHDDIVTLNLRFHGVEAHRTTPWKSVTSEMITTAYAKLVRIEPSDWLAAVKRKLIGSKSNSDDLEHLMIYFDDGPCYEFICQSFSVEEHSEPIQF